MNAFTAAAESATPEIAPVGRVHLSRDTPADWFEQATAETIEVRMVHGFPDRRWIVMPGRQNHYLDCRVYNEAAAEKLMLDTLGDMDWAALRADRYAPRDERQGDLLAPALVASRVPVEDAPRQPAAPADRNDYIDVGDSYL